MRRGRGNVVGWIEHGRERAPRWIRCMYIRAAVIARQLTTTEVASGSTCCPDACCPDVCVGVYCPGAYVNWRGNTTPLQFVRMEQYGECTEQHNGCDWLGELGEVENRVGEGEKTEM